ncbi:hypothetical protein LZ30DRAFT_150939 [Colletotrichum cereale]|nr:hypothetical protein LZ30DRAFT_150939 [Colletotrichum cereale]
MCVRSRLDCMSFERGKHILALGAARDCIDVGMQDKLGVSVASYWRVMMEERLGGKSRRECRSLTLSGVRLVRTPALGLGWVDIGRVKGSVLFPGMFRLTCWHESTLQTRPDDSGATRRRRTAAVSPESMPQACSCLCFCHSLCLILLCKQARQSAAQQRCMHEKPSPSSDQGPAHVPL